MIAMQLTELELIEAWQHENGASRSRATFPLVGVPGTASLGAVYFEVEPGNMLATHTDSQDEVLVILRGAGEGFIGDETAQLRAGALIFIPAMAPHGFRNTGTETLSCVGIFAGADVVTTFEHPLQPMGLRAIEHQALVAV